MKNEEHTAKDSRGVNCSLIFVKNNQRKGGQTVNDRVAQR